MRILNLLLLLASSVTVHAANIIETKTIIINDNFNSGSAGWTGIFADYNQAVVDEGMIAQVTTLPTELGLNGQSGFKLSASNRADDVYQGIYKKVSIPVSPVGSIVNGKTVGAPISIVSSIVFDISIASNAASSCFGVGGAPGSSVYAHFGAASVQPIVAKTATDYWTFTNIDKGQQSQSGPAGSVAGTIGVETDSCDLATAPYVIKPYTSFKPKSPDNKLYTYTSNVATSDLYLLVGTDSAFEARTTIYFVTIKATITATITYAGSTNPGPITTTTPPTVKPTVPPSTPLYETKTITINDNFNSGSAGWTGIFADYNQAVVDEGMIATVASLPTELGLNGQSGYKLSASNRADDVYQGVYKKVSIPISPPGTIINGRAIGAPISITSAIVYDVSLASNAADSCLGIGGSPGSSVYAKFGATSVQPVVAKTGSDHWEFTNIDKGQQAMSGPAGSVAGTIGVETECDDAAKYMIKPYTSFKPKSDDGKLYTYPSNVATSDLYLLVGTESAFEGRTTVYFVSVKATITVVITYAEAGSTPSTPKPTPAPTPVLFSTFTITWRNPPRFTESVVRGRIIDRMRIIATIAKVKSQFLIQPQDVVYKSGITVQTWTLKVGFIDGTYTRAQAKSQFLTQLKKDSVIVSTVIISSATTDDEFAVDDNDVESEETLALQSCPDGNLMTADATCPVVETTAVTTSTSSSSNNNLAIILGAAIGGVVLLTLVAVTIVMIRRRRAHTVTVAKMETAPRTEMAMTIV